MKDYIIILYILSNCYRVGAIPAVCLDEPHHNQLSPLLAYLLSPSDFPGNNDGTVRNPLGIHDRIAGPLSGSQGPLQESEACFVAS